MVINEVGKKAYDTAIELLKTGKRCKKKQAVQILKDNMTYPPAKFTLALLMTKKVVRGNKEKAME